MKVFITGASGFLGKATTKFLITQGHSVLGLARNDASATIIRELNAEVLMGDLEDLESLKKGATEADALIHLAFVHDFSSPEAVEKAAAIDKAAVDATTDAITGTSKPIVVVSGFMGFPPGHISENTTSSDSFFTRIQNAALYLKAWEQKNIKGSIVRLPLVHSPNDTGFISVIINIFKKMGKAYKIGEGKNHTPCVYISDVAKLLLLAIEKTKTPVYYHAISEIFVGGDFLKLISEEARLPVEEVDVETARTTLGMLSAILTTDFDVEFSKTQLTLGWNPTGPKLFEDMKANYF